MSTVTTDRFERQADLVPRQKLLEQEITVVGVGAIGRQVAIQLIAIGAPRLHLVDPDKVDETNITTQGYAPSDVGHTKVAALGSMLSLMEPTAIVRISCERWQPKHRTAAGVIFCCVDSIDDRSYIWRKIGESTAFWADGRMRGEGMRILTAFDAESKEKYSKTLFPQAEAQAGPCTAKSTIYTANIAAGLMVHQFSRWLRKQRPDTDLSLNLIASEMFVN